MDIIKILLIIAITFVLLFPMMPFSAKTSKVSTIHALKYKDPHNRKNGWYILLALVECLLFLGVTSLITLLVDKILAIDFIANLINKAAQGTSANFDYVVFVIFAVVLNALVIYLYAVLKGLLKTIILDPAFGFTKRKKKKKKCPVCGSKVREDKIKEDGEDPEPTPDEGEGESEDERRVPVHKKDKKEKKEEGEIKELGSMVHVGFWSLFFEGDDLEYAKGWVIRAQRVLQGFIYFVQILYALLFFVLLYTVFFPVSEGMYNFILNVLQVQEWYVYPFISLIFLQEICNVFNAKAKPPEEEDKPNDKPKPEEIEDEEVEANLRALHLELQRRFDADHCLRYYPEAGKDAAIEYVCTNRPYASSLAFIQSKMKDKTGRIVQSYMECLDAAFNENHVYFCASFYSELGDYLLHYTYTRLLSGSRLIFVLSNRSRVQALRQYISEALMKLTGTTVESTWRVYTSEERVDQADVLIATPDDFKDDNLVENYPSFFEEVCNAVFIDADRIVELESYLCPVMAIRLQKATSERIRFIFLSQAVLRGFAQASLPRFFCVDEVLSFSSANENEAVEFTLWNKESKRNVVYNKHGQTLAGLETIIAEQAVLHGVDGVRIITSSPLDRADKDILAEHNIEINEFYKYTPNINYMIYTDERANLAAALYVSTRFRGSKKSLVHIISNPYLLREYFMDKMLSEEYINRSSFIQPRVTEHAEKSKISFLRIFCDATSGDGISIYDFEERMKTVIAVAEKRGDAPLCPYCKKGVKLGGYTELNVEVLAGYLLAALCDKPDTPENLSIAKNVKDYYLIVDTLDQDGYTTVRDKRIAFKRVKEVFDKVFECNERVKLCINDEIIGELETFPSRVDLEYVVGQSILFNNTEYEIGQISDDRKIIFLRHENVTFKNCLDTIFLRRYKVDKEEAIGEDGVFNKTHGNLEEIRVSMRKANFRGETYGFYSLLSNCQTLDFKNGAVGNPHLSEGVVNAHARNVREGKLLRVTLTARMDCNDKMRLLMSAVFNEFIRTIFPKAYRQIAIVPVLEKPLPFNGENEPKNYVERVTALYPYLMGEEVETAKNRMQFLFINDCAEDIGALDWFYDRLGHYMHEFLANVFSYFNWLRLRPNLNHYIYFGDTKLPECFDLEGCCELLSDYNIILSESGEQDYETAGDCTIEEKPKRCSFCGKILESGRYSRFEDGRLICTECDTTSVRDAKDIAEAVKNVEAYLEEKYPEVMFGVCEVKFQENKFAKEDLKDTGVKYRIDYDTRVIYVEEETPSSSVERAILRAKIELWQRDNELLISYADAQTVFEELLYLEHLKLLDKATMIRESLIEYVKLDIGEIEEYIAEAGEGEKRTSFTFMREKYAESQYYDDEGGTGDSEPSELYDPNKIPRFWKRFLKGETITDGEDMLSSDDRTGEEDIESVDGETGDGEGDLTEESADETEE